MILSTVRSVCGSHAELATTFLHFAVDSDWLDATWAEYSIPPAKDSVPPVTWMLPPGWA